MSAGPAVRLTARSTKRLFHLVLESHNGRALVPNSEEKHEPASNINTVVADSLKALDPEWPIREADILLRHNICRGGPLASLCTAENTERFRLS